LTGTPFVAAGPGISGTIQSSLASSTNLSVTGGGTITFSSSDNNGLTGGLTVAGTGTILGLQGGNNGNSSAGASTLTIEAGATVRALSHNPLGQGPGASLSPLFINGGTFEASEYVHINSITMTEGTLGIRSGASQVDGMDLRTRSSVLPVVNINASSGGSVISSRLTLRDATTFTVADGTAAIDLLVSGSILGAASLTKEGAGIMVFNTQKAYTGGTTINGGTLDLTGGGGGSGTIRGTVSVNGGGTLRLSAGDVTGFNAGVDSLKTINLAGGVMHVNTTSNQTLGNAVINLTGGSITGVASSNLDFFQGSSAINSLASATTSTISGVRLSIRQTPGLTITVADGAAATDLNISSQIVNNASFTSAPLIKAGSGTLALTATNTYTGGTIVNAGVLNLAGGGGSSGTIRGTVTVNSGAILGLAANDVTGFSTGADSLKNIDLVGGTMHVSTTGAPGQNQTLGNAAINLIGGSITGVTGSNLDFFQGSSAINSLASATTSTISGVRLSIRQTPGLTITVADGPAATDLNISSQIVNNASFTSAPLIKAGSGTLALTATNTYTGGTTVNGGTLLINNDISIGGSGSGSGAVNVNAGTLGGTGSIAGPTFLAAGASLSPGNSAGTLTFDNNLSLAPGSSYFAELLFDGGSSSDLAVVRGTVSLGGALLEGTWGGSSANIFSGTFSAESMFWILDNQGSNPVGGTFANSVADPGLAALFGGVGTPYRVSLGGQPFALFYDSQFNTYSASGLTTGNDILLIATPEPSRAMLLVLSAFALLTRRSK
jgi:autotransporter-associated beta strand protein